MHRAHLFSHFGVNEVKYQKQHHFFHQELFKSQLLQDGYLGGYWAYNYFTQSGIKLRSLFYLVYEERTVEHLRPCLLSFSLCKKLRYQAIKIQLNELRMIK